MKPEETFLHLFNKLETWLKQTANCTAHESFSTLLLKSRHPVVKKELVFLKRAADLRNCIVHDQGFPLNFIATPNDAFLKRFERISSGIMGSATVYQEATKNPSIFSLTKPLSDVLPTMREQDFSQIIVQLKDQTYGLITREGIARWIENNLSNDIVSLQEVYLQHIHPFENSDTWKYIKRDASIFEAVDAFSAEGVNVQAILITEKGLKTEKPIGILTIWDIQRILKKYA